MECMPPEHFYNKTSAQAHTTVSIIKTTFSLLHFFIFLSRMNEQIKQAASWTKSFNKLYSNTTLILQSIGSGLIFLRLPFSKVQKWT